LRQVGVTTMNLEQVERWFDGAGFKLDNTLLWSLYKSLLAASIGHRVVHKFERCKSDPNVPGGLVRLPPLADDELPPFDWEYELIKIAKNL